MAIRPTRFSSYTPSCLSEEHYRVLYKGDNEVYLRFDAGSTFRYEDSVEELLTVVEGYEKSSFFARWRRRLSTPIKVEQQKLLLICKYFWREALKVREAAQPQPVEAGSVVDRLLKRAKPFVRHWEKRLAEEQNRGQKKHIRWLGLGKTHRFLLGDIQSLWQGILFFMRTLFSRKKTYTEEGFELKSATAKRALNELYADVSDQLTKSYFSGKPESPREWQRIVAQAEKELNARKEELRSDFRNPKEWIVPESNSQEELIKKLNIQNDTFDVLEAMGQEGIRHTKAKIEAFEAIRLHLVELEKQAKDKVKLLMKFDAYPEAQLAKLARERAQLRSKSFGSILFSSESTYLQNTHDVSIDYLKNFFADHQNRVMQIFDAPMKKISKKMGSSKRPPFHRECYQGYNNFLEAATSAFLLKDSESLQKAQTKMLEEWQHFSDRLSSDQEYKNQCLPEWALCVQDLQKALALSEMIFKKHEHYQTLFEKMESLGDFLGFAPTPARYRQLSQAHANGLREILASSHTEYIAMGRLSEQLEVMIADFADKMKTSEKSYRQKYPISSEIIHHRPPENKALACAQVYQNYVLKFMHSTYAKLSLNEKEFSDSIATSAEMEKILWEQLLQELSDLTGGLNGLDYRAEFQKLSRPWQELIGLFFEVARDQRENLKKVIEDSDPSLKKDILTSHSLQEGLQDFHQLSQERIFGEVQEKVLEQNGCLEDTSKSDLEQLEVDWLNRRMLSFKHDRKACLYFLFMKTQLPGCRQMFSVEHLQSVIKDCDAFSSEWRVLAVENMRASLNDLDLLGRSELEQKDRDLRKNRLEDYISIEFGNLFDQIESDCQEQINALQGNRPEWSIFAQRYLQWCLTSFRKKTLRLQKSTLIFYQKNPGSIKALEAGSELARWIKQAAEEYRRLIEGKMVERLEAEAEDPMLEITIFRDQQQVRLCKSLYERLAGESPIVQIQVLTHAQRVWDNEWRIDEELNLSNRIFEWRDQKEICVGRENDEFFEENKECQVLLNAMLEKKSAFWSKDWSEDELVFRRLLRWQRASLMRAARIKEDAIRLVKVDRIQKNLKKTLNNFLLVYHPDKYADDKAKQKFLSDKISELKVQVEKVIEQSRTPGGFIGVEDEFPIYQSRSWVDRNGGWKEEREQKERDESLVRSKRESEEWEKELAQMKKEQAERDKEQAERDKGYTEYTAWSNSRDAVRLADREAYEAQREMKSAQKAARDALQKKNDLAQLSKDKLQIAKKELLEKIELTLIANDTLKKSGSVLLATSRALRPGFWNSSEEIKKHQARSDRLLEENQATLEANLALLAENEALINAIDTQQAELEAQQGEITSECVPNITKIPERDKDEQRVVAEAPIGQENGCKEDNSKKEVIERLQNQLSDREKELKRELDKLKAKLQEQELRDKIKKELKEKKKKKLEKKHAGPHFFKPTQEGSLSEGPDQDLPAEEKAEFSHNSSF
jgi:hypothetical protein